MDKKSDFNYMNRVFMLAKKGSGKVSPNPLVGALLVKEGQIIGEGYHRRAGDKHAEIDAIESATVPVAGATLYCNLEPCCHLDKRTPPCAQRIINERIQRVVIAAMDPNPKVNGRGIALLKQAGLYVTYGVQEERCRELNRFYNKYITEGVPYISVKIAQTLDGKISASAGRQSWISCPESVKQVHRWRSSYDAVLVGAQTVRSDRPQLSVRNVLGRDPKRIIISGSLDLQQEEFYRDDNTLIFTGEKSHLKFRDPSSSIIRITESRDGTLSMKKILAYLAKIGCTSILVEGGRTIFNQFIFSGLADELLIFIAPLIWGNGIPAVSAGNGESRKYFLYRMQRSGQDVLLRYRK
jgi:diaminohydroxyphosphoribosylaminopyrimidine deaminase/5-amino-6-(5-phosphoribosylamino)uracil reductase